MKPKHYLPFFLLIILSGFLPSCSKTIYDSSWQNKPVTADGMAKEWTLPLRYYDYKSKLQYTVTNDTSNLYICIRACDEFSQMKIIKAGMQVWIDTSGKNKLVTGIWFPLANLSNGEYKKHSAFRDTSMSGTPSFQKPDSKSIKRRYERQPKEMQLVGFKPPVVGTVFLKNEFGIVANLDWDSIGIMTYEAIIPFKTFYKSHLTPKDSTKLFDLTIKIPAIASPFTQRNSGEGMQESDGMRGSNGMRGDNGMRGGSGMPGGSGMHGGNGMHGGSGMHSGYGNPQGDSGEMNEMNLIPIRIRLAIKPK